tara:strand:- start:7143 stop:7622 length:480 start_codon:yes stop_codon:yes gene_type:complete
MHQKRTFNGNEPSSTNMALPNDVLARLASLSGYDQMLEMDAVSRTHGVGLAEIETQIAAYKAGATAPEATSSEVDFSPVSHKEVADLGPAQPINTAPSYIDNPDQYRMKYDPSIQGQSNQSQVAQAIICPACSAPLGIPNVRPIKVTCPQCMHEAVFQS